MGKSSVLERESSPERLIQSFRQASGMLTEKELEEGGIAVRPYEEGRLSFVGAILFGSCTREDSEPHDLDVVLVHRNHGEDFQRWLVNQVETTYINLGGVTGEIKRMEAQHFTLQKGVLHGWHSIQAALQIEPNLIYYGYSIEEIAEVKAAVAILRAKPLFENGGIA